MGWEAQQGEEGLKATVPRAHTPLIEAVYDCLRLLAYCARGSWIAWYSKWKAVEGDGRHSAGNAVSGIMRENVEGKNVSVERHKILYHYLGDRISPPFFYFWIFGF